MSSWNTDTGEPGEDIENSVPAEKVKGLCEIYEGYYKWLPLFLVWKICRLGQLKLQSYHTNHNH